jgi:hypothetical protein
MRHRALDYDATTPVTELGLAALDDLLARGDFDDWAPLVDELTRDPWSAFAARLGRLVDERPDDGASALWRGLLDELRGTTPPPDAGKALRRLRERRGLTQAELARRLGATQPEVSKLEHRADVRLTTLHAYVGAIGGRLRLVARFGDEDEVLD